MRYRKIRRYRRKPRRRRRIFSKVLTRPLFSSAYWIETERLLRKFGPLRRSKYYPKH
jgi:hypothetical protein